MNDRPATAASPEPEPEPDPQADEAQADEAQADEAQTDERPADEAQAEGPTGPEVELRRRLDAIAATTTVADDAWATIQGRIDAGPATAVRARSRRVLALAAAVAMVVAVAAVVVALRGTDQGEVDTVDDETTTTTDHDRPRTTTEATTTTIPLDQPASVTPPGALDGLGDLVDGDDPGDGDGGGGPGTGPSTGPPAGGEAPTPTTPPPARIAPAAVAVTSDYTLELVFEGEDGVVVGRYGGIMIYLRRADGVGNTPDTPDHHGYITGRGWAQGAPRDDFPCFGFERATIDAADAPRHRFLYGFAGPQVDSAVVVLADGSRLPVTFGTGPGPAGLDIRGWIMEQPDAAVDHVEVLDSRGDLYGWAEIDQYGATTNVHC
jgi:hypothetical protein